MKKSKTPTVDRLPETLAALKLFKEGDRVFNKLTGQHGYFHSPNYSNAIPECWVRYELMLDSQPRLSVETPTNPLDLELCTASCHSLVEQLPYAIAALPTPDCQTLSELPNLSKKTPGEPSDSERNTPLSPATRTCKLLEENEENSQLLQEVAHARTFPEPTQTETDLPEKSRDCGGKCSELSENVSPDGLSGKTSPPPDTQQEEMLLVLSPMLSGVLPESATFVNGLLSAHQPLERPTIENESYLLLPTPMAHARAKTSYSHPGQDKLEQKLRELGAVPPGHISTPEFRQWMQGISSPDTTEADGGEIIHPQSESAPLLEASRAEVNEYKPLETCVLPSKERSLGQESQALQELTDDEERDLHRLELKVERAFYEAGSALREIRDRKLYRASHKTFESYCKDRFGFRRSHSYQLIDASGVIDNLSANSSQNEMSAIGGQNEMSTNGCQILPTSERQVRALVSLPPDEQRQVWHEAVEKSNGKVPSGAVVKGIVEQLKEKTFVPLPQRCELSVGDVVKVKSIGSTLRYCDGYWGIVDRISDYFYHVCISVKNEVVQCKGDELKRVETNEQDRANFKAISDRIRKLAQRNDLETTVLGVLEALSRKTYFSKIDLIMLEKAEEIYGIE